MAYGNSLNTIFYDECLKIEEEMKRLDPEKDKARLLIPRIKIANLMLKRKEDNSGFFFEKLFIHMASKSNQEFDVREIDLEQVIVDLSEEASRLYTPEKGQLYMFIYDRMPRRAKTKLQKLPKDEHLDSDFDYEDDEGALMGEERLFQKMKQSVSKNSVENSVVASDNMDSFFCDLAVDIIKFISSGSSRQIIRQRISQAMYSNDVLTVVSRGFSAFHNERAITSAMSIPYMNHCTVAEDAYCSDHALNIENMQSGKLKTDKETCWVPQEEPQPVLDGSEPEMKLPAMNEVYRGYLAQTYNIVRTPGTITQAKVEYEAMRRSLLNIG